MIVGYDEVLRDARSFTAFKMTEGEVGKMLGLSCDDQSLIMDLCESLRVY